MAEKYFESASQMRKYKITTAIRKTLLYAFLTIMAIFMLIPFYWMLLNAFKTDAVSLREAEGGAVSLFPNPIAWENIVRVFQVSSQKGGSFARYFLNTVFVALCSTFLTVITTVLASFAFARLQFKGKNVIFSILLATMMIPGEMMIITNQQTINQLGWNNTYQALILTHCVSVFYIFMLRQNFQQIPNELYLAAKVDGYGDFKYLWKVMLPITMPTIVTIIILGVMGSWNAYIWPQLVTSDDRLFMIGNGLMSHFQTETFSQDNMKLAASVVVTVPLFIFFLCFRKYIMRGVSRSGIKG